jgi:hypothetical protein
MTRLEAFVDLLRRKRAGGKGAKVLSSGVLG